MDARIAAPTALSSRQESPANAPATPRFMLRSVSPLRRTFVGRLGFLASIAAAILLTGCGKTEEKVAGTTAVENASQQPAVSTELQPAEIVSQLLDRVRRGGDNANSGELLTELARVELKRIGRPFEFPGSPDTTYKVGQAIPVPDRENTVWVQSYLLEPMESGESFQYEVVWTVRKETAGWRVSGFVVDQGEGMEPLEFNFENGDEMAARLAAIEQAEQSVNR